MAMIEGGIEGGITALLRQLSEIVSTVDLKECPSIIFGLQQAQATALARMTLAQVPQSQPPAKVRERYLRPKEVAERFGVTVKWLYKHKSKLPHSQPSRKILLFPEDGIHKWFASRARKGGEP